MVVRGLFYICNRKTVGYFFITSETLPTILDDGVRLRSSTFFLRAGQASVGFAAQWMFAFTLRMISSMFPTRL